jgi:hypothetical protein
MHRACIDGRIDSGHAVDRGDGCRSRLHRIVPVTRVPFRIASERVGASRAAEVIYDGTVRLPVRPASFHLHSTYRVDREHALLADADVVDDGLLSSRINAMQVTGTDHEASRDRVEAKLRARALPSPASAGTFCLYRPLNCGSVRRRGQSLADL